jgi:hypothetical protein
MPDSIKIARIAFVVAAGLEIATAALFLFIFIAGAGLLGSALLGAAGIFLAVLFAAFGVADLIIAAGIAKGRPWSRVAGTAMAIVLLIGFPVGTVLGVLALMGLLGRDARDWFGAPRIPQPAMPIPPPTV